MSDPLKIPRRFEVHTTEGRARAMETIGGIDPPFVVRVEKVSKTNRKQIGLYWRWLGIAEDATGTPSRDLDRYFRRRYLPIERNEINGVRFAQLANPSDLEPAEMTRYLRLVEVELAEMGIALG